MAMQAKAFPDFLSLTAVTDAAPTVHHDGACRVCARQIGVYRRQPGARRRFWVDASTCAESALGEGRSRGNALPRFHGRRADGVLVGGMQGFTVRWRAWLRFAWAGRIASFGPLPLLGDAVHRVFRLVRPLWQNTRLILTSKAQP
jgi:predicted DCC family thiol-disulfide oxidoreductase YuxK